MPVFRFPWAKLVLALAGIAAAVILVLAGTRLPALPRLEQTAADVRIALYGDRRNTAHPKVVVIGIDGAGIRPSGTRPQVDRRFLADLLETVDEAIPHAIGLDMLFLSPAEPSKDKALRRALAEIRTPLVLGGLDKRIPVSAARRFHHDTFVSHPGRQVGHLALRYEPDGVVRRHADPASASRQRDSFTVRLARFARPEATLPSGNIAWLQKTDDGRILSPLFNFGGSPPFTMLRAEDVLDPRRPAQKSLKGKIVLIGTLFEEIDLHRTALTPWTGKQMPGLLIHAQTVAQAIDGRRLDMLLPEIAPLFVLAAALIGGFAGWQSRHSLFLVMCWGIALIAMLSFDAFMLSRMRIVLPFLTTLVAWFAGVVAGHNLGCLYDWEVARAATRNFRQQRL